MMIIPSSSSKTPVRLTDLPTREPIRFVVYRYKHLYVAQGSHLTVVAPGGHVVHHELPFSPSTWASYGGSMVVYDRYQGGAQLAGISLSTISVRSMGEDRFSAPYATLLKNGEPVVGGVPKLLDSEFNGLMVQEEGASLSLPVQQRHLPKLKVAGAMVEPTGYLLFFQDSKTFSLYNGTSGYLSFGKPPAVLVPYAYPEQGLLAAGWDQGYACSPDMAVSWRLRRLGGGGVMTERAVMRVSVDKGVEVFEGWW